MVAIMADFRHSKDWFYSLRWVPARFFRNQLHSNNNARMEAVYRAHHELSPQTSEELMAMGAREYRRRYRETIMSAVPGEVTLRESTREKRRKRRGELEELFGSS